MSRMGSALRSPLLAFSACAILLPLVASAQSFPADPDWVPVSRGGVPVLDALGDTSPTAGYRDIVRVSAPSAFVHGDGVFLYFRMRVDGDPGTGGTLANAGWGVEVDADGDDTSYEIFVLLNGPMDRIELWQNSVRANTPTDQAEALLNTYPATGLNRRVVADGANDYFVDWAVPTADLVAAGATIHTPVRLLFGANANATPIMSTGLSSDIAGVGVSFSGTLASVMSDTIDCAVWTCSAVGVPSGPNTISAMLHVEPNPVRGSCRFLLASGIAGPRRLEILDVTGRRMRQLDLVGSNPFEARWDGRDERGRLAHEGVYFAIARGMDGSIARSFVVVR